MNLPGTRRKNNPAYLEKLKLVSGEKVEYHFWQDGPGHDRNLNEPAAIHEEIRYIHENPEKAGLIAKAIDWKWSSAHYYATTPPQQEPDLPRLTPLPPEWLLGVRR